MLWQQDVKLALLQLLMLLQLTVVAEQAEAVAVKQLVQAVRTD